MIIKPTLKRKLVAGPLGLTLALDIKGCDLQRLEHVVKERTRREIGEAKLCRGLG